MSFGSQGLGLTGFRAQGVQSPAIPCPYPLASFLLQERQRCAVLQELAGLVNRGHGPGFRY